VKSASRMIIGSGTPSIYKTMERMISFLPCKHQLRNAF
jgi:hypothetical protein